MKRMSGVPSFAMNHRGFLAAKGLRTDLNYERRGRSQSISRKKEPTLFVATERIYLFLRVVAHVVVALP